MRSIGVLIALLGVLALYCIYMILNISSGQMTPDETPLDYLPSSYQVKFFVQQNLTELLLVSIVLLSLSLLFAVVYAWTKRQQRKELSRREKDAHRHLSQYQSKFQKRLLKNSTNEK